MEVTLNELCSPKDCDSMWVAAPLAQECAEGYSGKGGVTINGVQAGSGLVASLPSEAADWIALIGRQMLNVYFASQQPIKASAIPTLTRASSRAVCDRE